MNEYIDKGDYYLVKITGTKNPAEFKIDKDDYEKVKTRTWYSKDGKGYIAAKFKDKTVKLHRFIMNVVNEDRTVVVDHINKDIFDNRKENLRITNQTVNNLNCKFSKNNTTGRTGVIKGRSHGFNTWTAEISYNGKKYSKRFSCNKYGDKEAYNLACKQREEWEKEFNCTTEKTNN